MDAQNPKNLSPAAGQISEGGFFFFKFSPRFARGLIFYRFRFRKSDFGVLFFSDFSWKMPLGVFKRGGGLFTRAHSNSWWVSRWYQTRRHCLLRTVFYFHCLSQHITKYCKSMTSREWLKAGIRLENLFENNGIPWVNPPPLFSIGPEQGGGGLKISKVFFKGFEKNVPQNWRLKKCKKKLKKNTPK